MKRPLAYITAAWCGSDHENTKLAAQYCRAVYEAGFSPICPTLYQPLFLNDAVPEEHKSGIDMGRDLLRRSHVLVVCGHMMAFSKQSEGVPMQTINLKQYYPFCKEDIFVEVSDEIVEAFLLDKRAEAARERKMFRYKAFYSLDCNDGIENAAIGWAQPLPEDYLIEKEELAEYEELIRRLYEAISSLPPMQARRVHARYMLGMKVKDIAAMEGITPSQAGKSIHAALRRLRRYFVRQKWTVNL